MLVKGRERSHARFLDANASPEPRCVWVKEPDKVAGEGVTCADKGPMCVGEGLICAGEGSMCVGEECCCGVW